MPTTQSNYKTKGFTFTQKSLTIPGQVLSVKQIRDRYQRGQSVQSFAGVYNPDVPPGYEKMTKIERIEALRQVSSQVHTMRDTLQNEARAKQKADRDKAFNEAVEKKAKELVNSEQKPAI